MRPDRETPRRGIHRGDQRLDLARAARDRPRSARRGTRRDRPARRRPAPGRSPRRPTAGHGRTGGGDHPRSPSTRNSQARANVHSFLTVAGDRSSAPAVSSMLRPAKYRSDTILRLARIGLLQPRQRFVDGDEIGRGAGSARMIACRARRARAPRAVLDALVMARALDENAAHRERGGRKEMPAPIPVSGAGSTRAGTPRGRARSAAASGSAGARGRGAPSRASAVRHTLRAATRPTCRAAVGS